MPDWIHVDDKHLLLAMKEYQRLGLVGAREKFGFSAANRVHMYYGGKGRPFEARVLVAIAHSIQYPNRARLTPKSFVGYGTLASKYLAKRGFEERPIVRTSKQGTAVHLHAA
ncbi:MAG: hypothetical protein IPG77_04910 [Betaproteobacteria bacterium]|nr:hypothetical protein [Betaproteobacteria bacterium]